MLKQSAPQELARIAPKPVEVTSEVLFGDVWQRPGLSPRDRSLVTVSVLAALYRSEQLEYHLGVALDNGLSVAELSEGDHAPGLLRRLVQRHVGDHQAEERRGEPRRLNRRAEPETTGSRPHTRT